MGSAWREGVLTGEAIADPRILDLVHLRRYTMDNQALERELLALFVGQLPSIVRQISQAATGEDWKFALHTLKGSARAIGATAIGELAEMLEGFGPADEVAALIGQLASEATRFEDATKKLLN
jgi:HPt (histidine-containing phosphotransfer) domain-containing protein